MRIPVIIVLIAALLTQSLSKGIIVLSYFTNKQAYERYCVNKARPQLHCDGKCQMAKKIKAEEEKDQKDPLKSSFSETVLILQDHFIRIQPVYFPLALKVNHVPNAIGHTREMSRSCFHPPDVA